MVLFPNSKINLGLNVVNRRADGYHDLETLFYPIDLCDVLEVVPSDDEETTFTAYGLPIQGEPESNLVLKAYRLLAQDHEIPPVNIYLDKQIPMGAGIGGGSADAAYMLRLLNRLFSLHLSDATLAGYALRLGADCPFFLHNTPLYAEGVGDRFQQTSLSLTGYTLVLVKPNLHISTKEAFGGIVPSPSAIKPVDIVKQPLHSWRNLLKNDFETTLFPLYPQLGSIKERLYAAGAEYASMSGSGSSIYGLFSQKPSLEANDFPGCYFRILPL